MPLGHPKKLVRVVVMEQNMPRRLVMVLGKHIVDKGGNV